MSLRVQAAADTAAILADTDDFGWLVSVTDPDGLNGGVIGYTNDVALVVDPQTGMAVSGLLTTVVLAMSALTTAGFTTMPVGVASAIQKPWRMDFTHINGTVGTYKVTSTHPDVTMDVIVCFLEVYKP